MADQQRRGQWMVFLEAVFQAHRRFGLSDSPLGHGNGRQSGIDHSLHLLVFNSHLTPSTVSCTKSLLRCSVGLGIN